MTNPHLHTHSPDHAHLPPCRSSRTRRQRTGSGQQVVKRTAAWMGIPSQQEEKTFQRSRCVHCYTRHQAALALGAAVAALSVGAATVLSALIQNKIVMLFAALFLTLTPPHTPCSGWGAHLPEERGPVGVQSAGGRGGAQPGARGGRRQVPGHITHKGATSNLDLTRTSVFTRLPSLPHTGRHATHLHPPPCQGQTAAAAAAL